MKTQITLTKRLLFLIKKWREKGHPGMSYPKYVKHVLLRYFENREVMEGMR